jgi:lipocalin
MYNIKIHYTGTGRANNETIDYRTGRIQKQCKHTANTLGDGKGSLKPNNRIDVKRFSGEWYEAVVIEVSISNK